MSKDCEICPSKLGTKEFWDNRYNVELDNYQSFGDEGEVWFGKSAEDRIIRYIVTSKIPKETKIMDVGCGNGSVLRRLRSKGYKNLLGIDYCEAAVKLARNIEESERNEDDECVDIIEFKQCDILKPGEDLVDNKHSVVIDKGTWDAMCLSEEREQRLDGYRGFLKSVLQEKGLFIIVSCNYTCEELKQQFGASDILEYLEEIPALHTFSFGGKIGATSNGVAFRRK